MLPLLAVVLLVAGCKQPPGHRLARLVAPPRAVDAGAASRPAPRPLTIQIPVLPAQLNPLVPEADLWCHRIAMHNIFEPLVQLSGEAAVQPHLARSFGWDPERRRLRFDLRENVTFHDGQPLGAADVVYTIRQLLGRNSVNTDLRARLHAVREVRELSSTALELRLAYSDVLLPRALAAIGIVAAHRYRRFGLRSVRLNRAPVGTGPFRFAPTADPATFELVRNERYWGKAALIDRVVFRAIAEPGRTLAALRNDEIDIAPDLYPGYYPKHVDSARFKARFRLLRLHPYQLRVLLLNARRAPLSDRRVRRALVQAVDRPQLLRTVRNDLGQLLSAPLWPLSSWYDRTLHPRSFDRQAAGRLLERAGWRLEKKGMRRRGMQPLRLRILRARGETPGKVAEAVLRDLTAVGIVSGIDVADFAYFRTQLRKGRFDLAVLGLALGPHDDVGPYLHSKGDRNYGGYRNLALDALLDSLRTLPQDADRTRIGRRLHRLLYEDPPMVVLYEPIELMATSRRVGGLLNNGRWPRLTTLHLSEGKKQ